MEFLGREMRPGRVRRGGARPAAREGSGGPALLALQASAGNRAVGRLVRRYAVQRDVGWSDAGGWNKGARPGTASGKLERIPLSGLTQQNQAKADDPAKTTESAVGRAVVWVHQNLDPTAPVQVVVHLHGLTSRGVDPFPGWREVNAKAKRGHKPNPLTGQVRDVVRDRIGEQLENTGDPQVMAVLPQGTGTGGVNAFGKDLNPDAMVGEALQQLVDKGLLKALPKSYTIVLSAHSAGGAAAVSLLSKAKADKMSHVGGLILLDALYGGKNKAGQDVSPQRDALVAWIRRQLAELKNVLTDPAATEKRRTEAIEALVGVRGYWEDNYSIAYSTLVDRKDRRGHVVKSPITQAIETLPEQYRDAVRAKFAMTNVPTLTHDQMIGGHGTTGPAAAPLQDALSDRAKWVAPPVARTVQRAPAPTTTGTVKLTWSGVLPEKGHLQDVLDKHPADLTATVREGKTTLTSGGSPVSIDLPAAGKPHPLKVVPTAPAPGDYFLPGRTAVTAKAGETVEASVKLHFNRENARFTEYSWELRGIDVAKANDVKPATLLGVPVIGGLNAMLASRIDATNAWFNDDKNVTPADRAEATKSIVSMAGRVKRVQTRGTYSNHSAGVAIDINPNETYLQNAHVHKNVGKESGAMKLFSAVVALPQATAPGGKLNEFAGFDVWKEKDRDKLLAASARFTALFPGYLLDLVAAADPARRPAPTAATVMALGRDDLTALAGQATTAKKPDVAAALARVATYWSAVGAWVGGKTYTSGKRSATLTGMIALHPAVVKALTETGWTWLVDSTAEKDFMHFEDRQAEKDLRTAPAK